MKEKTRKDLKKSLVFIGFVLTILVFLTLTRKKVDKPDFSWLAKESVRANIDTPRMMDQDVRFEGTHVSGNVFIHTYTLVNIAVEDIDVQKFSSSTNEHLLNSMCSTKNAIEFLREGVVFELLYMDRNSKLIYETKLDRAACEIKHDT